MPDSSVSNDIEALQADFSRLRADLSSLTKTLGELAQHQVANGADTLKQAGTKAAERLRTAAAEAGSLRDAGLDAARSQITEHPVSSLLIAFATGVLFGKLVDRR